MGGDPDMVVLDYPIEDACKTKSHKGKCGEDGAADIIYHDKETDTIYVWEVKIVHRPLEVESDVKHYEEVPGTEVAERIRALARTRVRPEGG